MFSFQHKFIFIHIPKTGGNSIQNVLASYSDDQIVCNNSRQDGKEMFEVANDRNNLTKHSRLLDYNNELSEEFMNEAFIFTCIRNPWERMISYYFSPHRGEKAWSKKNFVATLDEVCSSEYYLIQASKKLEIKYIRFERLASDFKKICLSLGIACDQFPHRNKSNHSNYQKYYDAELIEMVAEKSAFEISKFGYSFSN